MRTLFVLLFTIFTLPLTFAKQILIIHTNDLHSYFDGYYNGQGGYARVLTKIKELRANAEAKGIEVLQLDAGDWGDGTSFYLSDNGADSIRALEMLGTEVAAIGNHDHMIGGKVLGDQIRRADVNTQFVAANLQPTPEMELDEVISPYVDLEKGGIKTRVIGLTTSSNLYEYSMRPGRISDPVFAGDRESRRASREGKQLVIALTHLGLHEDKLLAQQSSSIDVIIGGHSHSKVTRVVWETNEYGNRVPIVQAWSHGLGVGALLLDVSKGGHVRVINYKLHEIRSSLKKDPEMANFVEEASEKRNLQFETDWNEVIGETKTSISGSLGGENNWRSTCWGKHMARATREAVGADVGIYIPGFAGVYRPAGPIRFGDIVDNFPHIRQYGDQGWEIVTVDMSGWKVRPLMYLISRIGYGAVFSGLGYKSVDEVQTNAIYTVALPGEIAEAIKGSLPAFSHFLRGLQYTDKYYWPVITQYVIENSPIQCPL